MKSRNKIDGAGFRNASLAVWAHNLGPAWVLNLFPSTAENLIRPGACLPPLVPVYSILRIIHELLRTVHFTDGFSPLNDMQRLGAAGPDCLK
jgi:hypothetical protein